MRMETLELCKDHERPRGKYSWWAECCHYYLGVASRVGAVVGVLFLKFWELCSHPVLSMHVTVCIYCLSFRRMWVEGIIKPDNLMSAQTSNLLTAHAQEQHQHLTGHITPHQEAWLSGNWCSKQLHFSITGIAWDYGIISGICSKGQWLSVFYGLLQLPLKGILIIPL